MRLPHQFIVVSGAILFTLMSCYAVDAGTIRLSAAASMTNVMKEMISHFVAEHDDITIIPNFGPSGGLAKQIERGAPTDLFISANPHWVNYLIEKKLIAPESRQTFATTSLVFVGTTTKVHSLDQVHSLQRIGIGSPKNVPAGQYAAQALKAAGLYSQLENERKLVLAKDVRQALIYADRGETDGSFVYATDAMLARSATILFTVDRKLHDPIVFTIGSTTDSSNSLDTKKFTDFFSSPAAADTLIKHGFNLPENN